MGAARADVGVRRPDPLGRGPHGLQPGVRGVDVGLLGGELGVASRLGRAIAASRIVRGRGQFSRPRGRAPDLQSPRTPSAHGRATPALHFTPDEEANRLLAAEPLAVMLGMLLDQQVPMEWAFQAPTLLKERLGGDARRRRDRGDGPAEDARGGLPGQARAAPLPGLDGEAHARRSSHVPRRALRRPRPRTCGPTPRPATSCSRGSGAARASGSDKARIFVGLLGKRLGVRPPGWEQAAADWASIADVDSYERVVEIREQKRAVKAAKKAAQRSSPRPDRAARASRPSEADWHALRALADRLASVTVRSPRRTR